MYDVVNLYISNIINAPDCTVKLYSTCHFCSFLRLLFFVNNQYQDGAASSRPLVTHSINISLKCCNCNNENHSVQLSLFCLKSNKEIKRCYKYIQRNCDLFDFNMQYTKCFEIFFPSCINVESF